MIKVAVITRTKNRSLFLSRAIKSVADQTYGNYVHVIVNDGGDVGDLKEVIDSFDTSITGKIKVFHREVSSNAPDTIFNESIDRVDSDYVAIHDSDDTWHPEFLGRCIEKLEAGAAGVSAKVDNVHEKIVGGKIQEGKRAPHMADLHAISLYRQCLDNQLSTIGFVYRRSAYEEIGKYDNSLPVVADWEFGIRFLQKYDVEYLDPGYALAFYHRHNKGDNSFALHDQRTYITKVLNRYLREDIINNKLGVGYIMNDLRYEQDMITANIRKLLPSSMVNIIRNRVRK